MNDTEKVIFELGTVAAGLDITLTAALYELQKALGDRAPAKMQALEELFVRDIKNNIKSTGLTAVPAEVMQSSISKLVTQVQSAFARARARKD